MHGLGSGSLDPERTMAEPVPDGFHTVNAHLVVRDAARAIRFYERAFGAREIDRPTVPGTSQVIHASMRIGDSTIMLMDDMPMMEGWVAPDWLGWWELATHEADLTPEQIVECAKQFFASMQA